MNPVTNKIYTANYGSRDATEIDGATNAVTSVPTGKHPWAIAVDSRANKTYVVNEDSASVSILDGATGATKNVTVGDIPFAVAVNPATNKAYVLTYLGNTMTVIDGATGTVTKTVPLATHPSAIAVNPKTNQIYIANQNTASVLVLDGETNAIIATVKAGTIPYAMAVDAAANQVYVANFSSDNATVIHGPVPNGSAGAQPANAWPRPPKFRVVALAERGGGDHQKFVDAARLYLDKLAAENDFAVDYITGTERINEESLAQYKLFIQLNYPPYRWAPVAKEAFEDYITQGKGGWIGFHHAALLGDFDGYPMDPWFSQFLGGIRFTHYLPDFAKATVKIEDPSSPLAKGLPPSFVIDKEEWYTWSQSPRPNVHVLATVDESSYVPNTMIKMGGDHPVVWSNPHYKARNVYIFMGHHGGLFDDPELRAVVPKRDLLGGGSMRKHFACCAAVSPLLLAGNSAFAQAAGQPAAPPRVLLFFSLNVEADHMLFATDAMRFFAEAGGQTRFSRGGNQQLGGHERREPEAVQAGRLAQQHSPERAAAGLPAIHGERRRMARLPRRRL